MQQHLTQLLAQNEPTRVRHVQPWLQVYNAPITVAKLFVYDSKGAGKFACFAGTQPAAMGKGLTQLLQARRILARQKFSLNLAKGGSDGPGCQVCRLREVICPPAGRIYLNFIKAQLGKGRSCNNAPPVSCRHQSFVAYLVQGKERIKLRRYA
jgi:hypothetical protein